MFFYGFFKFSYSDSLSFHDTLSRVQELQFSSEKLISSR